MSKDLFNLNRFVAAQHDLYNQVICELRSGQKRTHWMWFIFPQFKGLGTSSTSQEYAIKSLVEAQAYLSHPLLGARINECTEIVNSLCDRSALQIFGSIDSVKFCSSMTLFELATADNSIFSTALAKFFSGQRDKKTQYLVQSCSQKTT